MKKINVLTLLLIFLGTGSFAQTNFFTPVPARNLPQAKQLTKTISKIGVFRLNEKAMRNYLRNAPMEFQNKGVALPFEVPLPDGTTEIFNMVESPILSPEVAAANPSIKTYTGNGTRDKKSVIRVSLTSLGFSAVILNVGGDAVYFESYSNQAPNVYFNYFAKDVSPPAGKKPGGRCGVNSLQNSSKSSRNKGSSSQKNSGAILRTFRIAVAANGEFTAANGGTQASSFAIVVNYVNNLTAVYRNELSVNFMLVSGTNLIYTNAATDPYTNSNQNLMLDQNQTNLNLIIGSANYDIGHVWGTVGGSGGGVASLEAVCDASIKARGVSGEGDGSYAQVFNDQLFFHEVGHQFGMTHSYNSSIPVCTSRNPATSVEPGSGATIMSYGFTCDDDDYFSSTTTGPILNFHTVNYDQAEVYMANPDPGYGNCFVGTATGNTPPVVTVPGAYTIPKSTPFSLTGSATDANDDALSYSWEGTNIGTMVPDENTLSNTAKPPFFRTYAPVTTPTRIYPLLSAILDGSNYAKGDKLPYVSIATTHRFTVRDNNSAGGGVNYESVTVTVDGNIGPFLVTSNLSGSYNALTTKAVTWSVNGTNTATPNVKISLSTDGGFTFPIVLAASTPNDGTQTITFPNNTTTTARLKVESVGNIFFDISNNNFTITPASDNYTITASAGTNGSISPSGAVSVASGASKTFSITPNACYKIATVLVDGVSNAAAVSSGKFTFTNVTANHTISATFTPTPCGKQVVSFTLVNANTEQDIQTLSNGATLNLATLPTKNLNIRANTSPSTVGRVVFALTGAQTRNQTEIAVPYALFSNNNGDYYSWIPPVGNYTLKATPFTSASGGTAGTPLTISFKVINQAKVVSFTLVNASTEQDIQTLSNGATLNLATLPKNLNIRANTSPSTVGRVVFALTGAQTRNQTEDAVPYALFSDDNGNYYNWGPPVGSYTLKATPFTSSSGGTAGTPLTINFKVTNNSTAPSIADVSAKINLSGFTAEISPNPSINNFTLRLNSNSAEPVEIKAVDMLGRSMYQTKGSANKTYRFGQHFIAGTYIIQVQQGKNVKTLKAIKN